MNTKEFYTTPTCDIMQDIYYEGVLCDSSDAAVSTEGFDDLTDYEWD